MTKKTDFGITNLCTLGSGSPNQSVIGCDTGFDDLFLLTKNSIKAIT